MKNTPFYFVWLLSLFSCQEIQNKAQDRPAQREDTPREEIIAEAKPVINYDSIFQSLPDDALVEIAKWDTSFVLDIRYATKNNFTQTVLYPCGRAFLRKKAALALLQAHQEFKELGYRLKIWDAYRPHAVQFKMWKIIPNDRYVGNPALGSVHNRGVAIDVTLVDQKGKELDMGTAFDHFGVEAHISNQNLSPEVLENRKRLRDILGKHGFAPIESEWWHYNYQTLYPILDKPIPCESAKVWF